MTVNPGEFRALLDDMALDEVVRIHVLAGDPVALQGDAGLFEELQVYLGDGLAVEPEACRLVGSAQMGYSISPDTFPRQFGDHSDLDLVSGGGTAPPTRGATAPAAGAAASTAGAAAAAGRTSA